VHLGAFWASSWNLCGTLGHIRLSHSNFKGSLTMNGVIPNISTELDPGLSRTVTRLEPDATMVERFTNLMQGVTTALESSNTVMVTKLNESDTGASSSLQERIVRDVSALEKGFGSILKINDANASQHLELSSKENEIANSAEILFEYSKFNSTYFIATNYARNSAESTSESIQIFTKSK
jgi:hypothetical protein